MTEHDLPTSHVSSEQEIERLRRRVRQLEAHANVVEQALDQCPVGFLGLDSTFCVTLVRGQAAVSLELPSLGTCLDTQHPLRPLIETALTGHSALVHRMVWEGHDVQLTVCPVMTSNEGEVDGVLCRFVSLNQHVGVVDATAALSPDLAAADQRWFRMLEGMFEAMPLAVQFYDRDGYSYRMNEAQRRNMGLPDKSYGVGEFNVLTDAFVREIGQLSYFERAYQGETVVHRLEIEFGDPSNVWQSVRSTKHWHTHLVPIRDAHGAVDAVVVVAEDRTSQVHAEQELARTRRLLEGLFEHAPIGFQIYDGEGTSVRMNGALRRLLDLPSAATGVGEYNVLTDPSTEALGLLDAFRRAYRGEVMELAPAERDFGHASNDWPTRRDSLFLRQIIFPVHDDSGRVESVVSCALDVTDQMRALRALEAREAHWRALWNVSQDALALIGPDGCFLQVSPSFYKLYRLEPGHVVGRHVTMMLEPEVRAAARLSFERSFQDGPPSVVEESVALRGDGSRIFVECSVDFLEEGGQRIAMLTVARDITERVHAQRRATALNTDLTARLQARDEQLRLITEHIQELVITLDHQGDIVFAAPSMCRVLGHTLKAILGKPLAALVHPDDMKAFEQATSQSRMTLTLRLRHVDGSWRHIDADIQDASLDGASFFVIVGRDMTDRHHLEAQIHQMQRLEAVGRLAGGVAHDFNNLLMVITTSSELLQRQISDDKAGVLLRQLNIASERGARLTKRLLTFASQQPSDPQVVDVRTLFGDLEWMLRRVLPEHIKLDVSVEGDTWPIRVDPGQFEQVIVNVAVNARDAMPAAGELRNNVAN